MKQGVDASRMIEVHGDYYEQAREAVASDVRDKWYKIIDDYYRDPDNPNPFASEDKGELAPGAYSNRNRY